MFVSLCMHDVHSFENYSESSIFIMNIILRILQNFQCLGFKDMAGFKMDCCFYTSNHTQFHSYVLELVRSTAMLRNGLLFLNPFLLEELRVFRVVLSRVWVKPK